MAFDTTVFEQKEFREAINKLEELLSHSKAVLSGAGASFCAGLPLTNQLTETALESEKFSADSKQILTAIQTSFAEENAYFGDSRYSESPVNCFGIFI